MKSNDWKDRLGIMYSTNPDFQYNTGDEEEEETLPKEKQLLRIALDKRNRGGKAVTLVSGFRGTTGVLEALGKYFPQFSGRRVHGTGRWLRCRIFYHLVSVYGISGNCRGLQPQNAGRSQKKSGCGKSEGGS